MQVATKVMRCAVPQTVVLGLCLLLAAFAPRTVRAGSALEITNVAVVNVTPSSFSVVWSSPGVATSSVAVFADSGGVTSLAGKVGVEYYPLHTGSPTLTNAYARRLNESAIRQKTLAQGIADVRVSDLSPATTYYYRLQVWDEHGQSVVWPASGPLPSVTTATETSFAIQSQQLLLSIPGLDPSGSVIVLSNTNTPSLLASVAGDGAPSNQVYFSTIDFLDATGARNFVPLGNQQFMASVFGNSSNQFSEQSYVVNFTTDFTVGQGNLGTLGNYAVLTVGSVTARAGATAGIPVGLYASGITNLTCVLNLPTNLFSAITLQSVSSQLATATLSFISSNEVKLTFSAKAGQALIGNQELALLNLTTLASLDSTFIPLDLQSLGGLNADGSAVNDLAGQSGRLTVVGESPLLELLAPNENGARNLALYGLPGTNYEIQISTNLTASSYWSNYVAVTLTDMSTVISGLDESQFVQFYRAVSFVGTPPSAPPAPHVSFVAGPVDTTLNDPNRLSEIVARYPLLKFSSQASSQESSALPMNRPFLLRIRGR